MKKIFKSIFALALSSVMLTGVACGTTPPPGGGDGGNVTYFEGGEELAYSLDRLENADLSFSFTTGRQTTRNTGVDNFSTFLDAKPFASDIGLTIEDGVVTATKEDMGLDPDSIGWFESHRDSIAASAERIEEDVSYFLSDITVLDKLVMGFGSARRLQYDEENDVVTASTFRYKVRFEKPEEGTPGVGGNNGGMPGVGGNGGISGVIGPDGTVATHDNSTIEGGSILKIYNDEDGDEVIESYLFSFTPSEKEKALRYGYHWEEGKEDYSTIEYIIIKYSKEKHYYYAYSMATAEPYEFSANTPDRVTVFDAKKVGNQWKGVEYDVETDSRFFKANNTEDSLYKFNFFLEVGDGFYTMPVFPTCSEDGVIESFDDVEFLTREAEFITGLYRVVLPTKIEGEETSMWLGLYELEGWESLEFDVTEAELNDPNNAVWFGGDDHITLANGKKIYTTSMWNEDYGWIKVDGEDTPDPTTATFEDGTVMNEEQFTEWKTQNEYIDFTEITAHITAPGFDEYYPNGVLRAGTLMFNSSANTADCYQTLTKLFKQNGLSLKGMSYEDVFKYSSRLDKIRDTMVESVTKSMFGKDFNLVSLNEIVSDLITDLVSPVSQMFSTYFTEERMLESELPDLPTGFNILSLSGKVSGQISIDEYGIDFSDVKVNMPKTNLFREGSEYGVFAVFDNGKMNVVEDAFNVITYARKPMSFKGKDTASIIDLAEGTYTLKLCFAKKTQDGLVRISEYVNAPVKNTASFTRQAVVGNLTYNVQFSVNNGILTAVSTVIDNEKPTFYYGDMMSPIESGEAYAILGENACIADLINFYSVSDNYDGEIFLMEENVTADGQPVSISDPIDAKKTYVITVVDSHGNVNSITIEIGIMQ